MPMMRDFRRRIGLLTIGLAAAGCASDAPPEVLNQTARFDQVIALAEPVTDGSVSLEASLAARRSERTFTTAEVAPEDLGQLLWAGQGITDGEGHRTAPSAGARYPIELYVITDDEVGRYQPEHHQLESRGDDRVLPALGDLAFGQAFVSEAPLVIAIVADPARTEVEYGAAAEALVDREAGHVAQNILLQATALGLASVPVGGFDPAGVAELLALPPGRDVRYLIPVG